MLGGTATVQFSAGHTVDTKGTSPLEKKKNAPYYRQGECVGACPALPLLLRCLSVLLYVSSRFLRLILRKQFTRR